MPFTRLVATGLLAIAFLGLAVAVQSATVEGVVETDPASMRYGYGYDKPYYPSDYHGPKCPDCNCPVIRFPARPKCKCTVDCDTKVELICETAVTCSNQDCPPSVACDNVCACTKALPLSNPILSNGCNTQPCVQNTGDRLAFCKDKLCPGGGPSTPTGCSAAGRSYAFCRNEGHLCYKFECPKDGGIHIQGSAIECCEGAVNGLHLYCGGGPDSGQLVQNSPNIDYKTQCHAGETFFLCELVNVINLDSVRASFTYANQGNCPSGYNSAGCVIGESQCPFQANSNMRAINGTIINSTGQHIHITKPGTVIKRSELPKA